MFCLEVAGDLSNTTLVTSGCNVAVLIRNTEPALGVTSTAVADRVARAVRTISAILRASAANTNMISGADLVGIRLNGAGHARISICRQITARSGRRWSRGRAVLVWRAGIRIRKCAAVGGSNRCHASASQKDRSELTGIPDTQSEPVKTLQLEPSPCEAIASTDTHLPLAVELAPRQINSSPD